MENRDKKRFDTIFNFVTKKNIFLELNPSIYLGILQY
jgi:hypothetical protein